MVTRFRRKPGEIKAVQFDGTIHSARELQAFGGELVQLARPDRDEPVQVTVQTLNGPLPVNPTDWLATTGPGDFYPITAAKMGELYDPAEAPARPTGPGGRDGTIAA